ncbi:bifunctional precorrin-2 dehydrogenase/sirohydrochlorin ferrochelatase [Novosphingobium sp.]|uniref:precorrin-2 dehydrogenase/sirohydrochlorin ferrochelatase family protein n=1 Tax=Novosphingobium sp. TaxID=1874826 RepID=UPI0025EF9570|nr:siroheme synthase [Novosphingobium sp.]
MQALPLFHKLAGQPVIVLGDGEAAVAKRRLVERAGGVPVPEDDAAARLAFVAIDDEGEARAAVARLKARGLLVNATDRPELCDFTVPSLIDRDPVVIAVGTGGVSAGLAKAVRLRLDALLPPDLGGLARALQAARGALRTKWPDPGERRHAIDAALAAGGTLDPLGGGLHGEKGQAAVEAWLASDAASAPARTIEVVLTSDDPDDLTLRAVRLLGSADVVVHDGSVPASILVRARADAIRVIGDAPQPTDAQLVIILRRA